MTDTYNEDGRLMQHSVYSGSCGSDEFREEYTYAEDGSRTARTWEIRGKNSPPPLPPVAVPGAEREVGPTREIFQYDASGRLTEISVVRSSGKVVYKISYRYDSKGRLIEVASFDGDGQLSSRRVQGYEGDEKVPSNLTDYGHDGKIYEKTVYSEYEFDSYGNWIKRKEYTEETYNRRNTSLTFRNIEYYKPKK
ncbi:MAG: RHS repeat domain-containing protein [Acidobacteriota bacterium]